MFDRRREDLARLVQIIAGIQHLVDVGPIPGPLLDLVEVEMVRDDRVVSLVVGLVRTHSGWIVLWRQAGHVDFSHPTVGSKKSTLAEVSRRGARASLIYPVTARL